MKNKQMVFIGMGFELIGIVLGAVYLGSVLDAKWGTKGLMLAGLPFVGMVGWIYHIVILLKKEQSEKPEP